MSQTDFNELLDFFKVLADENRLKLLGILALREYSVEELAALLQLKAPTISHHLGRLKETGLVKMRSVGNVHLYQLDAEKLRQASKGLLSSERMADLVPRQQIEKMEESARENKVLGDFFEGPRLKEIPANRKKRTVILRWLVKLFEPGTRYSEKQVNEIIKRHHADTATLRRELIAENLLQREHGIYWRPEETHEQDTGKETQRV